MSNRTPDEITYARCYCGRYLLQHAPRGHDEHTCEPDSSPTSNPKTPDEWSLEDARKYAAEARERGHNPEDQCNSGWLVRLDVEIERLTRELEAEKQVNDLAYTHPRHLIANRNTLRAALAELADETQAIMRGEHGADWADHFTPLFNLIQRAKALSDEPNSAHETTAKPQAPIARITVKADRCYAVELYAPGLPAGVHDLYCEPEAVAPMMREKRAYYETHDPPHCPTCDCGTSPSKASERTCKWTPIEEGSPVYTPGCPGSEEWQLDDGCELCPYCQWCGGKIVVKALADEGPSENGGAERG